MAKSDLVELAVKLVATFTAYNPLPRSELPGLIHALHSTVERLAKDQEIVPPQVETKSPAVPIRKSITPDYLICLEDGKRLKSLRRHLGLLGLSPEQYRVKWKLPPDYPMVAPNYAAQRSELAKKSGLGSLRRKGGVGKSTARSKAVKA